MITGKGLIKKTRPFVDIFPKRIGYVGVNLLFLLNSFSLSDDVFDEEDIADRSCFPSDDQISDRDGEHYCVRYDPAKMFGLGESGGIARYARTPSCS